MKPNIEETVREFKQSCATLKKESQRDPQKARDFLVRAGIAVRDPKNPSRVKLARRFS